MSSIQSVWERISPTLTRLLMAWGAASWPTMWPGGRGVHHHQVVVALAHLVAELAHGEDLPHPGRRGGHEVERLGQRADPAHHRDPQLELQVLAERGLGVHGHGEQPREDLLLLEAGRRRLVEAGHVALGVDLADQHPLAPQGGQQGQRRGHRGLAHPTLAGDEDQLEVEERVHRRRPRPMAPAPSISRSPPAGSAVVQSNQEIPKPTRRSEAGGSTST